VGVTSGTPELQVQTRWFQAFSADSTHAGSAHIGFACTSSAHFACVGFAHFACVGFVHAPTVPKLW